MRGVGVRRFRRWLFAAAALSVLVPAARAADGPVEADPLGRPRVPILMYHVVAPPLPNAPFPELFVRPAEFAAQMKWLARHGYHGVTLRRVYDAWHARAVLPAHPVVVSFDDGYLSQYTHARPVLERLHWPAVLNLEVRNTARRWGLSPPRVHALIADGWEIDAHTLTHPDLTTVDDERLRREVAGSRHALQHEFQVPVDFFCYPSGRFDARVIAAVQAAGFLGATTTLYGLASAGEPFTLHRVRINGSDDVGRFAAKLESLHT